MEEIDEAFNWLVVILGILAASLTESMHLFPLPSPPLTPKIEIEFMNLLFVPLIVLVISWLSAHLVLNKETKIVLKSFSWIYAIVLLLADLLFFLSVIFVYDIRGTLLGLALMWVPSVVYLGNIRKRYKLIFPDSKFLNNNKIQVFFCIMITLFADLQMIFTAPMH